MSTEFPPPICLGCEAGRHADCLGTALDEQTDLIVDCDCAVASHYVCDICVLPLHERTHCEDDRDHCDPCRADCPGCSREDDRWEQAERTNQINREEER